MIGDSVHITINTRPFDLKSCLAGTWLALLHAHRVPPHIGLMINGNYNSLTVKGQERNVPFEAVYKTAIQKKIECVFIKVTGHPVFSDDYRLAVLQEMIGSFPSVKQDEATCLSPVKEFFQEFFAVKIKKEELLFDFIERLNGSGYLEYASACNFTPDGNCIALPFYTAELLNERIKKERMPFYND